jgi:hypothetical protein
MAIVATYFEFNTTVYGVVLFCTLVALHRDSTELFYAKKMFKWQKLSYSAAGEGDCCIIPTKTPEFPHQQIQKTHSIIH